MAKLGTAEERRARFRTRSVSVCRQGVMVVLLMMAVGCGSSPPPSAMSAEDLKEFQQTMLEDAHKTGEFAQKTENGKNLSEFTLGWFMYNVLSEVSSQDDGLYAYFNQDSKDLQGYLKTTFHDNPEGEINKIDGMAKQGHPTLRQTARYALESLRHIPDSQEPPETQAEDRQKLASSLETLQQLLERCANETALPTTGQADSVDTWPDHKNSIDVSAPGALCRGGEAEHGCIPQ